MRSESFPSASRSRRIYGGGLLGVAVLFAFGYMIWHFVRISNAPNHAEIREATMKYSLDHPDLPPALSEFEGRYASFFLLDSYHERRHEISDDKSLPILEQVFFTQLSDPGRKVALTIEQFPSGNMRDLSSYSFRLKNPNIYFQDTLDWDGKQIPIFTKRDVVYEVTGYMETDGKMASLSISSAVESPEELMSDFSDMAKSFRWSDIPASRKKE